MTTQRPSALETMLSRWIEDDLSLPHGWLAGQPDLSSAFRAALHERDLSDSELAKVRERAGDVTTGEVPLDAVFAARVERALASLYPMIATRRPLAVAKGPPRVIVLSQDESGGGPAPLLEAPSDPDARILILSNPKHLEALHSQHNVSLWQVEPSVEFPRGSVAPDSNRSPPPSAQAFQLPSDLGDFDQILQSLAGTYAERTGADAWLRYQQGRLVGETVGGKYRVVRKLGAGGFGVVYEAIDENLGNRVAIKFLSPKAARSARDLEAFKAEARRVARLSHRNIVDWKVFDRRKDGSYYFVMEYVDGVELDAVLRKEPALAPKRVASILLQIVDALRAAHHLSPTESVLHLDLKPSNVFLARGKTPDEPELVKVIDFGIGQYVGGGVVESDGDAPAATTDDHASDRPSTLRSVARDTPRSSTPGAGSLRVRRSNACTPEYASPEQCAHNLNQGELVALDGRSDLYSLGIMGYQMLTGELPFTRPLHRRDWLKLHRDREARKLTGRKGIPKRLARFIDRCLMRDRELRFRDANEAYTVLHRIVHPVFMPLVTSVSLVLLLLAAAVIFQLARPRAPTPFRVDELKSSVFAQEGVLYFGPARPEVLLRLYGAVDETQSTKLRLVADKAGAELSQWTATWAGRDQVKLAAKQDATVPPQSVRLEIDREQSIHPSEPIQLAYVASDAWRIESISIANGERSITLLGKEGRDADASHAVDPRGLDLEVNVAGDGRFVDRVEVQDGNRSTAAAWRGEATRVKLPESWEWQDGGRDVNVVVWDKAGRAEIKRCSLSIVTAPLAITVCEPSELVEVFPSGEASVRVDLNHAARLDARIGTERIELPDQSQQRLLLPVGAVIKRLAGGKSLRGTIELKAEEGESVLRASPAPPVVKSLPFEYKTEDPAIEVALITTEGRNVLSPNRRWQRIHDVDESLSEPQPAASSTAIDERPQPDPWRRASSKRFVRQAKAQLEVAGVPLTTPVGLLFGRALLGERTAIEFELVGFDMAATYDEETLAHFAQLIQTKHGTHWQVLRPDLSLGVRRYDLDFEQDGAYTAFLFLPGLKFQVPISYDQVSPKLEFLSSIEDGTVIQSLAPKDYEWKVSLVDELPDAAPVDLEWQLWQSGGQEPLEKHSLAPPTNGPFVFTMTAPWVESRPNERESYEMRLVARDAAGNVATVQTAWSVHIAGPSVDLLEPKDGEIWVRSGRSWLLRMRATSPIKDDYVASVRVEVEADRAGLKPIVADLAPRGGGIWEGDIDLDEEWSDQWLRFRVRAVDREGTATERLYRPRLGRVAPYYPNRIQVPGDAETGAMTLVPGNATFTYVFRGRGDDVESKLFQEAGLGTFNGLAWPKSWEVAYDRGEIEDFYLDEREVTAKQFRAFLLAPNGYRATLGEGDRLKTLSSRVGGEDTAVIGATWGEARAYADWAHKRLPSFVEWEYAVRKGIEYWPYANYRAGTSFVHLNDGAPEWTATPSLFDDLQIFERFETRVAAAGSDWKKYYLRPELLDGWDQRREYWVVGNRRPEQRVDFSSAMREPRHGDATGIGFRCAVSAKTARHGGRLQLIQEGSTQ